MTDIETAKEDPANSSSGVDIASNLGRKNYGTMTIEGYYGFDYLRKSAYKLWQFLSEIFKRQITKTNLGVILESISMTAAQYPLIKHDYYKESLNHIPRFPSGALSVNSAYYIERPPIEARVTREIQQPGSFTRIRAPQETGKTSLLLRILEEAKSLDYHTVYLNLKQADTTILSSLERFLRWFCVNISRQLQLPAQLDDYWDEDLGSKVSSILYLEGYIFETIKQPIVLAIDDIHLLFDQTQVARDFLPLIRSLHEEAKQQPIWRNLRIIVVHSTEIYVPLKLSQSPFNVGLPIKLPPFNRQQIQQLAERYGLKGLQEETLDKIMALVGGHPALIQRLFYYLTQPMITLENLLAEAPTAAGIYSDHLRRHLTKLRENSQLAAAFKSAIAADTSVELEPISIYKLDSLGLVTVDGNNIMPSCELYRQFFLENL